MKLENIFSALQNEPRLLIEAELKPVQGSRFQPTGFPDLGAATFKRPNDDGTSSSMLLVESAQSMANRLETVCWNKADDVIDEKLNGLSHVIVKYENGEQTSSIQEAHRLNSFWIFDTTDIKDQIAPQIGKTLSGTVDIRKVAQAIFRFDASSILHGIFFAKANFFEGRARLQRLLSGFIESEDVVTVASGGAKLDRFSSKGAANEEGIKGSEEGRGNIIYAKTEFAAKRTCAFFNLDLATMRGYGLGENAEKLLIALSLFKIIRFLNNGLRLRTACDFNLENLTITRPKNLTIENTDVLLSEIEMQLPELIRACDFGEQPLQLQGKTKKKDKAEETAATTDKPNID